MRAYEFLVEYKHLIDLRHDNSSPPEEKDGRKPSQEEYIDPSEGFFFTYMRGILAIHSSSNFYYDANAGNVNISQEDKNMLSRLWNNFSGKVVFTDKLVQISKEYVGDRTRVRMATNFKEIQNALKDLQKFGVDKTFKLKGLKGVSAKTVGDVLQLSDPYDDILQNKSVTMYHGTSAERVPSIMKKGLEPGNSPDDYIDLVPGFSEHNIYLTFNSSVADFYAKRQAKKDHSKPVVLKVTNVDPAKLIADDRRVPRYKYFSDTGERRDTTSDEKRKAAGTKDTIQGSRETGEYSYRGRILPQHIEVVKGKQHLE